MMSRIFSIVAVFLFFFSSNAIASMGTCFCYAFASPGFPAMPGDNFSEATTQELCPDMRWRNGRPYICTWEAYDPGPSLPGAPSLTSPADRSNQTDPISFSWSQPSGSPTRYHIQLSTNSSFSQIAYENSNQTSTSITFRNFTDGGTTYYWRVRAGNQSGWGSWSQVRSFINGTASTRIIRLTGDLSFGNVTVGQNVTRTLTIHNDGNSTLSVTGISYPSGFSGNWSGNISAGGSRNVTVTFRPTAARNYSGTITVSSNRTGGTNTRSCSGTGVETPSLPGAPPLISPANGSNKTSSPTTGMIHFSWSSPSRDTFIYHIQLSTCSNFSTLSYDNDERLVSSVNLINFPDDGTIFYWRVRGRIPPHRWGPWSEVWSFTNGTAKVESPSLNDGQKAELIFDWLESIFPELLYPAPQQTQEIQKIYYRYYHHNNVFIATYQDALWFIDPLGELHYLSAVDYWLLYAR